MQTTKPNHIAPSGSLEGTRGLYRKTPGQGGVNRSKTPRKVTPNDRARNHTLNTTELSQVNIGTDINHAPALHDALSIEVVERLFEQTSVANVATILDLSPQRDIAINLTNQAIHGKYYTKPRERGV
jgi:hypothetical protein